MPRSHLPARANQCEMEQVGCQVLSLRQAPCPNILCVGLTARESTGAAGTNGIDAG
jgi:hypothetical protein